MCNAAKVDGRSGGSLRAACGRSAASGSAAATRWSAAVSVATGRSAAVSVATGRYVELLWFCGGDPPVGSEPSGAAEPTRTPGAGRALAAAQLDEPEPREPRGIG